MMSLLNVPVSCFNRHIFVNFNLFSSLCPFLALPCLFVALIIVPLMRPYSVKLYIHFKLNISFFKHFPLFFNNY